MCLVQKKWSHLHWDWIIAVTGSQLSHVAHRGPALRFLGCDVSGGAAVAFSFSHSAGAHAVHASGGGSTVVIGGRFGRRRGFGRLRKPFASPLPQSLPVGLADASARRVSGLRD
jgi:hypothetical protein